MIPSGKNSLLLLSFLLFWNICYPQDLFNAENSKKFAHYLFTTRQYNLAATEYERILNSSPADIDAYSRLIMTCRHGQICNQSFKNLNALDIKTLLSNSMVAEEYLKLSLTCNCCYQQTDFENALNSLDFEKQLFYRMGHYFFNDIDSLYFFSGKHRDLLTGKYSLVLNRIHTLENFKGKSPWLAMTMSTILPGSGKAYSGYWGDAVMSFVFVASNAWLSYRGFSKKGVQSASGWIFGSVSLGFYLGNIWGSGRAAKTYNQMEYEKIYNEAKNSIYSHF